MKATALKSCLTSFDCSLLKFQESSQLANISFCMNFCCSEEDSQLIFLRMKIARELVWEPSGELTCK